MTTQIELPTRARRAAASTPLTRARSGILFTLLGLSVASWVYLARQGPAMSAHHGLTPTMGLGVGLFLLVWIAMTMASMFPAVSQTVLTFAHLTAKPRNGKQIWLPTWLFVSGYLLLWSAIGLGCYVFAVVLQRFVPESMWSGHTGARIGGGLIVVAGLFQFSALKDRCLTECRAPLAFLMRHWHDGRLGAVRMGVQHGLICAGCCWALMVMLFPLGMTDVVAMRAVSALILAERTLPLGPRLARLTGVVLIVWGVAVLTSPGLLPGFPAHAHHVMVGMN